jgi:hypothetical protein
MGSVDRYLVLDVPATYLFLILMSSSYVKCKMFAWLVRIPSPGRRVTRGGGIRRPQAQSSMEQEQLWRASPLRRNALAVIPPRRSKFSPVHSPPRRRET